MNVRVYLPKRVAAYNCTVSFKTETKIEAAITGDGMEPKPADGIKTIGIKKANLVGSRHRSENC